MNNEFIVIISKLTRIMDLEKEFQKKEDGKKFKEEISSGHVSGCGFRVAGCVIAVQQPATRNPFI